MKIKVTSDGTPHGSDVVNAETGERIDGVTKAVFVFQVGKPPAAWLKFICVETEIVAELKHGDDSFTVTPKGQDQLSKTMSERGPSPAGEHGNDKGTNNPEG